MSENMPTPSAFSLVYRADDTAILLDSIQNFRVADFCCPADLLHLSPYPHFKSFNPFHICFRYCLCLCCIQGTLHTRHLTIHFLKSRFILLVRIFFLSMNFTFANPILLLISLSHYPSSAIITPLNIFLPCMSQEDISRPYFQS